MSPSVVLCVFIVCLGLLRIGLFPSGSVPRPARPLVWLCPTPCCGCCSGAFLVVALGDPEPSLHTVRAACAHLLGPVLLSPLLSFTVFPGAFSLLLLLASACFLSSRPCSHQAIMAATVFKWSLSLRSTVLPALTANTHLVTVTSSLPARIFQRLACP